MKLETLTAEQEAKLITNRDFYVEKFLNNDPINKEIAKELITFVYSLIDKPCPEIIYVQSPVAAKRKANELNGTVDQSYEFGTYLTIYYASFYAYYDTFVDFGIITEEEFPDYFKLRKFVDSNIFLTIEFDDAIIVCEKPQVCLRNELGDLHSTKGKAIAWGDDDKTGWYYINGRHTPDWVFEKYFAKTLTFDDFMKESNDDIRGAILFLIRDNEGAEGVMKFLDAVLVDEKSYVHTSGHLETMRLFKTKQSYPFVLDRNGNGNNPYTFFQETCPSTGTVYYLDSSADFKTVDEAAKWHRPSLVPMDLPYDHEQFNN